VLEDYVSSRGLKLYGNTPNPANGFTLVKYALDQRDAVHLDIYSVDGQLLQQRLLGYQEAGAHHEWLDLSDLRAGTYFYSVNTTNSTLFGKLVVAGR
jgi:hypothetical protein